MTAGGILRVKHVGPGALSVTPSDHVDCAYEAAVHDCRLLKSGNVTFTIIVTSLPRSLVVVVIP
jgi:hypothetical protein